MAKETSTWLQEMIVPYACTQCRKVAWWQVFTMLEEGGGDSYGFNIQ